jgi:hypothetical protein
VRNCKLLKTAPFLVLLPGNLQGREDLAEMELIKISEVHGPEEFLKLLKRLRKKSDHAPSLDEITAEVEEVRKMRYE